MDQAGPAARFSGTRMHGRAGLRLQPKTPCRQAQLSHRVQQAPEERGDGELVDLLDLRARLHRPPVAALIAGQQTRMTASKASKPCTVNVSAMQAQAGQQALAEHGASPWLVGAAVAHIDGAGAVVGSAQQRVGRTAAALVKRPCGSSGRGSGQCLSTLACAACTANMTPTGTEAACEAHSRHPSQAAACNHPGTSSQAQVLCVYC